MKHIVSCSFGKDSLAMLFIMIKRNLPIDEVVFFDTGMEFQAIYDVRDKVVPILDGLDIKYTELHPEKDFMYMMLEKPVKKRGTNSIHRYGYSWCGGVCRWGTTEKLRALEKHCKGHYEYVGIAFDEPKRLEKERKGNKVFPLAEWEMTEKQCLAYCYGQEYFWEECGVRLYEVLDRVSCWCCRNKNLKELRGMYTHLPLYWEKLKILQSKLIDPMKGVDKSVFDLEKRFKEDRIAWNIIVAESQNTVQRNE